MVARGLKHIKEKEIVAKISEYTRELLERKKEQLEVAILQKLSVISAKHREVDDIRLGITNLEDKIKMLEEDLYGD